MGVTYSVAKAQSALLGKVQLAMAKKTMDVTEQKGQQMVDMLKTATHPTLGKNIDMKA
ncbi:YjfB family protein [Bacillus pinisoli]|uniref:YjfB family protein n=1 Tax=Bacillus pinisoli TaxID=2901866 RepID=UPI001FF583D5|nr:YjfB family protein [Bacillus pinisoli]